MTSCALSRMPGKRKTPACAYSMAELYVEGAIKKRE